MAKTVFFSFHYQRDVFRVQQIKNHYLTKGTYTEAGYFDGSLEEKAKKEGDSAVKGLIDQGLKGSTVLCVLIGNETYTRRWVYYEIFKSIELGMGVFGIRVHQMKNIMSLIDVPGFSPFECCGYAIRNGMYTPMIHSNTGWFDAPYLSAISRSATPYLKNTNNPILSNLFAVYDWITNDGYNNFGLWVEAAAKQANHPAHKYRLI